MMLLQEPTEADETSLAERRRGLRIAQDRPIKVLDMFGGRYFGGRTHDVSATGLRIELPATTTIRNGQMLSIHVGLTRTGESLANRRQMIPARVVWITTPTSTTKTLTAGVEFTAMTSAQLDAA